MRPLALSTALLAALPAPALALDDVVTPRALALGESLRAGGSGAAALFLNPAAIANAQQYVLELDYHNRPADSAHILTASVVDSVTASVAAGVFYHFLTSEPEIGLAQRDASAHEAGLGLAFPISPALSVGAAGRFLKADTAVVGAADDEVSTFTADAGLVLRFGGFHAGVAGTSLVNDPPALRRQLGAGLGYAFGTLLLAEIDGRWDFDRRDAVSPRYSGGLELFLAEAVAVRAGAAHEVEEDSTFVSGGLGYVSGGAAVEASARQQVDGGGETLLGVGVRIFTD